MTHNLTLIWAVTKTRQLTVHCGSKLRQFEVHTACFFGRNLCFSCSCLTFIWICIIQVNEYYFFYLDHRNSLNDDLKKSQIFLGNAKNLFMKKIFVAANQIYPNISEAYSAYFVEMFDFLSLFCQSAWAYKKGGLGNF